MWEGYSPVAQKEASRQSGSNAVAQSKKTIPNRAPLWYFLPRSFHRGLPTSLGWGEGMLCPSQALARTSPLRASLSPVLICE